MPPRKSPSSNSSRVFPTRSPLILRRVDDQRCTAQVEMSHVPYSSRGVARRENGCRTCRKQNVARADQRATAARCSCNCPARLRGCTTYGSTRLHPATVCTASVFYSRHGCRPAAGGTAPSERCFCRPSGTAAQAQEQGGLHESTDRLIRPAVAFGGNRGSLGPLCTVDAGGGGAHRQARGEARDKLSRGLLSCTVASHKLRNIQWSQA